MSTFWNYVKALRSLGVEKFASYLTDGHSEYFGANGYQIASAPAHEKLTIAEESNKERFLEHLSLHEQRKTDYITMSKGLAESGIEKWTVNTGDETMIYYDKKGNAILKEKNA